MLLDMLSDLPRDLRELLRSARPAGCRCTSTSPACTASAVQLDGAANRLAIGIVTAAFIVGSSIVMTVEGGPTLFGLPLFGVLGFVGALVGGAWLFVSILRSGR